MRWQRCKTYIATSLRFVEIYFAIRAKLERNLGETSIKSLIVITRPPFDDARDNVSLAIARVTPRKIVRKMTHIKSQDTLWREVSVFPRICRIDDCRIPFSQTSTPSRIPDDFSHFAWNFNWTFTWRLRRSTASSR